MKLHLEDELDDGIATAYAARTESEAEVAEEARRRAQHQRVLDEAEKLRATLARSAIDSLRQLVAAGAPDVVRRGMEPGSSLRMQRDSREALDNRLASLTIRARLSEEKAAQVRALDGDGEAYFRLEAVHAYGSGPYPLTYGELKRATAFKLSAHSYPPGADFNDQVDIGFKPRVFRLDELANGGLAGALDGRALAEAEAFTRSRADEVRSIGNSLFVLATDADFNDEIAVRIQRPDAAAWLDLPRPPVSDFSSY